MLETSIVSCGLWSGEKADNEKQKNTSILKKKAAAIIAATSPEDWVTRDQGKVLFLSFVAQHFMPNREGLIS